SLTVKRGEVTSLLGRNGVGKTSTLRAIVGQHPVTGGKIIWDGKDITSMTSHQRAREGIAV
ncbi:MAG TPA: ABC transporter ATP-binding protein, partial [Alcanivorax sp.]|nr:ABC transporter ATP-binding protein [Alcanivorax sp.]